MSSWATIVRAVIRRWTTTATDSGSGCATSGAARDLQGAGSDRRRAGGDERRADPEPPAGRVSPATVPERRFGEAALNLSALLGGGVRRASAWPSARSGCTRGRRTRSRRRCRTTWRRRRLPSETCTASGTKFFDLNANGRRDPDDPGIPRFQIWADYNDDGIRDANEPFSVSDNSGRYVIHDIRPPDGTYRLREKLLGRRSRALPVARDWRCSYPNASTPGGTGSAPNGRFQCGWGPLNVNTDPEGRGARLRQLVPGSADRGETAIPVDRPGPFRPAGRRWGRSSRRRVTERSGRTSVAPGTYTISERAVTGTDPAAYRTAVWCRRCEAAREPAVRHFGPGRDCLPARR